MSFIARIVDPVRRAKVTATMTVNVKVGSPVFRLPARMYAAPILLVTWITVAIVVHARLGKAIAIMMKNVRAD